MWQCFFQMDGSLHTRFSLPALRQNTLKNEQRIISMQELTLFGGLAKAQTRPQIASGVWTTSVSASFLTYRISIKKEQYQKIHGVIVSTLSTGENDWQKSVCKKMVRRSFQIWRRLTFDDVMRGLALKGDMKPNIGGHFGAIYTQHLTADGRHFVYKDDPEPLAPWSARYGTLSSLPQSGIEAAQRRARMWRALEVKP
jgi:hypothetical protein